MSLLTGGHVSIVNHREITRPGPREEKQGNELVEVDWKKVLSDSLSLTDQKLEAQRSWAKFSDSLRELCPESEWLFLRDENFIQNETEALKSIENLMKAMTSSEAWPFPEKIFISAEGHDVFRTWKITVLKTEGQLPFITPATNITMTNWSDEYTHGYKIRAIHSYTSSKSGEA